MPLTFRSIITYTLFFLLLTPLIHSQTKHICLNIDRSGNLEKAYKSFEKDLFNHYTFNNDTIKTYRAFLTEIASLSIDLRKFPSSASIQLARTFKNIANDKNSLWIKLSEYENQEASKKSHPTSSKNKKEILTFNYRGGFIQCLKNNSDSEDFRSIINKLEGDGNISTSLTAQRIYYLSNKELNTLETKKFIAFDIYYSILLVIEKAFG